MRMIVFFDLPTETYEERKEYRNFRQLLINSGFLMMQESVYSKLALNNSVVNSVREKIITNKPKKGLIQMLVVTEKQFTNIEYIQGESNTSYIDNTERLIIL